MNRIELKKVMSDFSSISHRLSQAGFYDYLNVLRRLLNFVETTDIIKWFINECGGYQPEIEESVKEVIVKSARFIFSVSPNEEVSEIYSVLKCVCDGNFKQIPIGMLRAYSSASTFDGMVKDFNHRVVFVLVGHIENYLRKVGIEMGLDNNVTYNINGTQVNIANDDATINATQNNGINTSELKELIAALRNEISADLSNEDKDDAKECVDVIEKELLSGSPNEQNVKSQFKILKRIDCGVKFASACCSLLTFADKVYPFLNDVAAWFTTLM